MSPALRALAELTSLEVVDRVLTAEHEHEEQLRQEAVDDRDRDRRERTDAQRHSLHREAGAVDELLEHHRVLCLLDDLVLAVAELGIAVFHAHGMGEQPAL